MRYVLLLMALTGALLFLVAGRRGDTSRRPPIEVFPDMDRQPKLRPQTGSDYFKDGFSSQGHVPGTVARGSAWQESAENTGRIAGTTNWVQTIPLPVTAQFMARGRERYDISCSPCHGVAGDGKGITTKLGMAVIADLHDVTARKLPQQTDGELFHTISQGKGLMQGYAASVSIEDRWAIVAYVRALQRGRLSTIDDVPVAERAALSKSLTPAPAAK